MSSWLIAGMAIYLGVIVIISIWSTKYAKGTLEDYTMASRSLGFWVLFSSVFAANISAITFIGIPGVSYHVGWIAWPYFVTCWAWFTPLLFWLISPRSWLLGSKMGLTTQAEILRSRWDSRAIGYLFSIFITIWTVLFMITGIRGGGATLAGLTDGYIPYWFGALIITLIVCSYLLVGGLRGAAWINCLQAAVFVIGIVVVFFMIANAFGGPVTATQEISTQYPELLDRSQMSAAKFYSFGIILALAVPVYPMVFMRMLAGRSPKALKGTVILYPVVGLVIFVAAAYSGMWAHLGFPGLEGAQSDYILPMALLEYLHPALMGLLGAAIFAAIMSTLDAQLWALSVLIIKDFISPNSSEKVAQEMVVKVARMITLIIACVAYVLALVQVKGIISLAELMNAGFAPLLWPMLAALYWKRCTKEAVIASLLSSQLFVIGVAAKIIPASWNFGMLPGFPGLIIGLVVLIVVTYITPAPTNYGTEIFFSLFNKFTFTRSKSISETAQSKAFQ